MYHIITTLQPLLLDISKKIPDINRSWWLFAGLVKRMTIQSDLRSFDLFIGLYEYITLNITKNDWVWVRWYALVLKLSIPLCFSLPFIINESHTMGFLPKLGRVGEPDSARMKLILTITMKNIHFI